MTMTARRYAFRVSNDRVIIIGERKDAGRLVNTC